MKVLNLYTGGHPFKIDDVLHLQSGIKEAIKQIAIHLKAGVDAPYILWGAAITGPTNGPWNVSAGAIYYQGEIYLVDAAVAVTNTSVGPVITGFDWLIQETYVAPSPVTYQNATSKNVHAVRKMVLVDNTITPGDISPATSVTTISSAITTDVVAGPSIPWTDTGSTGINSGSTLTDYIQTLLDEIAALKAVVQNQFGGPNEFKAQITPISGNLYLPTIQASDPQSNLDSTNTSGSAYFYEGVGQGIGNKQINTIHFNDTLATGMYDNGNNWFGNKYLVPVAGTYNFYLENLTFHNGPNSTIAASVFFLNGTSNYPLSSAGDLLTGLHANDVLVPDGGGSPGSVVDGTGSSGVQISFAGTVANFRVALWVRRAGATLASYNTPEVAAYIDGVTVYTFTLVEEPVASGDWKALAHVPSFNTLNKSASLALDPSVTYDDLLGLSLLPGDEVYFIVLLGSGGQTAFHMIPIEGVATCVKTS